MVLACFRRLAPLSALLLLCAGVSHADTPPTYQESSFPLEQRVEALFQAMTPDERLSLLSGTGWSTQPIPRLQVPPMFMDDAGQGVRGGSDSTKGKATLFASGVLLSSTWDVDLVRRIAGGIGEEALNKGTGAQILLGPDINIIRSPLGGRDGEFLSEDPFLTSRVGVAYVEGLQQTGCLACVKAYACNNQEFGRDVVDVHISERALREIYTPAFLATTQEGQSRTVMSAYNLVNGEHCTTNAYLLKEILKNETGYDGVVLSDWWAVHESVAVARGNDLEMPGGGHMKPSDIRQALANGTVAQADVDDAVHRIIRAIIRSGLMDGSARQPDHTKIDSPEHRQLSLEAAQEGIVLLKNDKAILPLDPAKIHSIALIGPFCKNWQMGAQGSPSVDPAYAVKAYDGIVSRAGSGITITYSHGLGSNYTGELVPASVLKPATGVGTGLTGEYFADSSFTMPALATRLDAKIGFDFAHGPRPAGVPEAPFTARWTGTLTAPATGMYRMNIDSMDGARLYIDDKLIQDTWPGADGSNIDGRVDLQAHQAYRVRIQYVHLLRNSEKLAYIYWTWLPPGTPSFAAEKALAQKADVAIVFAGTDWEAEDHDRRRMALPGVQADLIHAVTQANPNTIVVLNNGGPVQVSDWIDGVPGLLEAYFPGEQGGAALAQILFGDINPSGKLVYTVGKAREDYPDFKHYPITSGSLDPAQKSPPVVDYAEGIYVGYRYFDIHSIEPSFPFGFGLSYTTFRFDHMQLSAANMSPADKVTVTADITNTGTRAGAEIVQLYMHALQPRVDRPVRELKGFARVLLAPGETRPVTFTLTARDLAYCDVPGKEWKADAGDYTLELGDSSRDLRANSNLHLDADYNLPVPGMGTAMPGAPTP